MVTGSSLAVHLVCGCGVRHPIPVPDKNEVWTEADLKRVVCSSCGTTVEDAKIEPVVSHAGMKAAE